MTSASASKTAFFQREVTSRFGLVPNFFSSAPDAPEITERLWAFAMALGGHLRRCSEPVR